MRSTTREIHDKFYKYVSQRELSRISEGMSVSIRDNTSTGLAWGGMSNHASERLDMKWENICFEVGFSDACDSHSSPN